MADKSLLHLAIARSGIRKGMRAATFIATWAIAREALDKRAGGMTVDEYAAYWREPVRTSYRHLREFRETFPGESYPDRLVDAAVPGELDALGQAALVS